jgi:hypothetical protein
MKRGRLVLIVIAAFVLAGLWSWGGILLLAKYKRESRLVREYEVLAYRYPLPAEGYKTCLKVLGSNPRPGGQHFVPVYDDYEVVLYWDALAANGRGEWKLAREVLRRKPPEVKSGVAIDEKTALALGQYHAETHFRMHPEQVATLLQEAPRVTHAEKDGSWQVAYIAANAAEPGIVFRLKPTGGLVEPKEAAGTGRKDSPQNEERQTGGHT